MLYYDRIDISKGIDLAKSNNSKECMICHYWLFNHELKFQNYVCNGCHDLTMLSVNISDVAIITVKNVDYRCIVHKISKFCSGRLWVYIKKYCLKFQSIRDSFSSLFYLVYIKWLIVWTSLKSMEVFKYGSL